MADSTRRLTEIESVGGGAMAVVSRGVLRGERGVEKTVAVKRLRPERRDDPEAIELFVNEASIAVRLSHPHVVAGIEFARDEAGYYLVCEWLDGVTAEDLRRAHGPLPWVRVLEIGRALCDALGYLHRLLDTDGCELQVLHRDITPSNVFVSAGGQIKLADFGVATCNRDRGHVRLREVGTPGFAAPEQSHGSWDARSDVYGVGATLRTLGEPLPEPLTRVLEVATRPDPEARYASADALGEALAQVARELPPDHDAPSLAELVRKTQRRPSGTAPQLDSALQSLLGSAMTPPERPESRPVSARRSHRLRWLGALAVAAVALAVWAIIPPAADPNAETLVPPESTAAPTRVPLASPPPVLGSQSPTETTPKSRVRSSVPVHVAATPSRTVRVGRVGLNAVPWAHVELDGRPLGNTPLRDLVLTEGTHVLVLTHPPEQLRGTFSIDVEAQATQTFLLDLRRGTVTRRVLAP